MRANATVRSAVGFGDAACWDLAGGVCRICPGGRRGAGLAPGQRRQGGGEGRYPGGLQPRRGRLCHDLPGSRKQALQAAHGEDGETYTYDLNSDGAWEIIPLQLGTGTYAVKVFKQASGNKYSSVSSQKIQVDGFSRENACFLCPNQYVYYTPESAVVALSQQLCANLTEEREKVQAVRDW